MTFASVGTSLICPPLYVSIFLLPPAGRWTIKVPNFNFDFRKANREDFKYFNITNFKKKDKTKFFVHVMSNNVNFFVLKIQ
ncbi:hypothetical protein BpHYR1_028901 [Brachionus plicatilis]|uniref:Uncharacterized protein n=1 Tax=Brachionus plicatilis TaxID=10195 RepID=A0A3M7RZC0_BRAPC|nr:hypothetical protein BpHYR1_028901 [Brachionus plicatilis]